MHNFLPNLKRIAIFCMMATSGTAMAQNSAVNNFLTPDKAAKEQVTQNQLPTASVTVGPASIWTGAVSSDWHNPANWHNSTVPNGPGMDATIPAGTPNNPTLGATSAMVGRLNVFAGATVNVSNSALMVKQNQSFIHGEIVGNGGIISFNGAIAQTLNSNGGKFYRLEFANGAGVTVNGAIEITDGLFLKEGVVNNTAGIILLKSDQNGTAFLNNFDPSFTGSLTSGINFERYLTGSGYRHIGAPLAGEVLSTLGVNCLLIRSFEESSNSWLPIGMGCELQDFDSYGGVSYTTGSNSPNTISYGGFPVSGNVTFPLVRTNSAANGPQTGWNSLYNPYASPIDWDQVLNTGSNPTVTNGAVWIWNSNTNSWATRTFAGVNANGASNIIAAGQGFMVRRNTNGSSGILFALTPDCRLGIKTTHFLRSGKTQNNETIRFQLIGTDVKDETVVHLTSLATAGIDNFDAERPTSLGKSLELSTLAKSGEKLMVNAISSEGLREIPLSISTPKSGTYQLMLTENLSNLNVQILDLKTGRLTPAENGISIAATEGEEISSRYKLIFNNKKTDAATTFTAWAVNAQELQVASLAENLSSLEIFNSVGQKLGFTAESIGGGSATIKLSNATSGILFVRSGSHTERVVMSK